MIVGALLCRNEADRYLKRVLANASQFCDKIVAIDDASTDDTKGVLEAAGVQIVPYGGTQRDSDASEGFWGADESTPRATLWNAAVEAAGPDGWIYVTDADQLLVGLEPQEFRALCKSRTVNSWSFRLHDCWNDEGTMRQDSMWQAHWHPRPWLLKAMPSPDFVPIWQAGGLHVGHFPTNYPLISAEAPGAIRHLGYVRQSDRLTKCDKYGAALA